MKDKLTYGKSGVDYSRIDPLKIMAQKAARETSDAIARAGFPEIAASRGESAYVFDCGDFLLASIAECLGTKALVADAVRPLTGKTHYDQIAQDTLAMAINDIITVGAKPLSVHAYWAAGGSDWFSDEARMRDLVDGWKRACDAAGVTWGGGETPSLSGVVMPGAIDLAASCVGVIRPKERLSLGEKLGPGDAIVLLESSGIHANGITLARKLAERLPQGWATRLSDGRLYGEALLDPTILYSPVTEAFFEAGIAVRYMSNITGHGWRKIMRHPGAFTYRLTVVPPVPPVLSFIAEQAGLDPAEAYGSLNMGAGFAVYVPREQAAATVAAAESVGVRAYEAGYVEAGEKKVVIEALGVVYDAKSLDLRA